MRAAIYRRKSTKQERANEEALSTTRQKELATTFATSKGWEVVADYCDEAISGAEYEKRPAYQRMMADAVKPTHPWDAIIVMEQSRLGRDTGRVLVALKTLEEADVQVWSYQTRQQITLGSEAGEVNATVMGLVDTLHKRQASTRTRETLHPKAQRGEVAGSKVYGYDNVRESKGGPAKRVPNEVEAKVVERVFTLAASMGNREIARTVGKPTTTIANMLRNSFTSVKSFTGGPGQFTREVRKSRCLCPRMTG